MLVIYRNNLILVSLFLASCMSSNPSHKPAISGDIMVKFKENSLCFTPDFNSATFNKKDLSVSNASFDLQKLSKPSDGAFNGFIWEEQVGSPIKYGFEICIKDADFMEKHNKYMVCMRGLDKKVNQNVSFCTEFLYGDNRDIKSLRRV